MAIYHGISRSLCRSKWPSICLRKPGGLPSALLAGDEISVFRTIWHVSEKRGGRRISRRLVQPFSDSTGADIGQIEYHEFIRVTATPIRPSTRTVPPIITATIPTFLRSLFSDIPDISTGTLSQSVSAAKLDDSRGKPNPHLRPCRRGPDRRRATA